SWRTRTLVFGIYDTVAVRVVETLAGRATFPVARRMNRGTFRRIRTQVFLVRNTVAIEVIAVADHHATRETFVTVAGLTLATSLPGAIHVDLRSDRRSGT